MPRQMRNQHRHQAGRDRMADIETGHVAGDADVNAAIGERLHLEPGRQVEVSCVVVDVTKHGFVHCVAPWGVRVGVIEHNDGWTMSQASPARKWPADG